MLISQFFPPFLFLQAGSAVCRQYDEKCRQLRHQESRGESQMSIDKTRAVVKDLHSRILVAIQRIDMISKNIEDLRDKELQPQLEELIGRYIYPFNSIQLAF
jgi:predicted  nucleic acid-binding Zn-ribbon protein